MATAIDKLDVIKCFESPEYQCYIDRILEKQKKFMKAWGFLFLRRYESAGIKVISNTTSAISEREGRILKSATICFSFGSWVLVDSHLDHISSSEAI